MGRIPKKLRLPLAGVLTLGLLAAAGVTLMSDDEGGHLAANRAQLKKACGGLLPYDELRDHVPDDVRGTLDQYGTLLQPGQESRSLLNCTLDWEERGGMHVEAATLVNHLPYEVKTEDLLAPGYEAPGVTGRESDDKGRLWIVAECPKGLTGRARPASQMYVSVGMDKVPVRTEFRIAVHVANAMAERQHCGTTSTPSGTALNLPTRVIDTYEEHDANGGPVDEGDYDDIRVDEPGRGAKKCGWMSAKGSAPVQGTWTTTGDLQQSRLVSVCRADRQADEYGDYTDPQPADLEPVTLDATSWVGELGRSAYRDYERDGEYPGFDDGPDTIRDDDAELALWARSECAGGTTYHRVSVRPNLDEHSVDLEYGGIDLTRSQRAELSGAAKKLMTSYLNAPDGWPKVQDCHGTKLLGEVEQWR
ncbi:hypothetical protein [Streptomyces sp. KR55]|uniref:hypothetical protein n=1 Tax=Streptomyces sp. KR55 TaxID=3457425 RepID=UPI003FCF02A4